MVGAQFMMRWLGWGGEGQLSFEGQGLRRKGYLCRLCTRGSSHTTSWYRLPAVKGLRGGPGPFFLGGTGLDGAGPEKGGMDEQLEWLVWGGPLSSLGEPIAAAADGVVPWYC